MQQQTIPTETMASESINPNIPVQEPELNLLITDKQFERMKVFHGKTRSATEPAPEQISFF